MGSVILVDHGTLRLGLASIKTVAVGWGAGGGGQGGAGLVRGWAVIDRARRDEERAEASASKKPAGPDL